MPAILGEVGNRDGSGGNGAGAFRVVVIVGCSFLGAPARGLEDCEKSGGLVTTASHRGKAGILTLKFKHRFKPHLGSIIQPEFGS